MDKIAICHQQSCQQQDIGSTSIAHDAASSENLKYSEIELQFKVFVMQRLRERIQELEAKVME